MISPPRGGAESGARLAYLAVDVHGAARGLSAVVQELAPTNDAASSARLSATVPNPVTIGVNTRKSEWPVFCCILILTNASELSALVTPRTQCLVRWYNNIMMIIALAWKTD